MKPIQSLTSYLAHYTLSQARFKTLCDNVLHRQAEISLAQYPEQVSNVLNLLQSSYNWGKEQLSSKSTIAYTQDNNKIVIDTFGTSEFPVGCLMQLVNKYEDFFRAQLSKNYIVAQLKMHLSNLDTTKIIIANDHNSADHQEWLKNLLCLIFDKRNDMQTNSTASIPLTKPAISINSDALKTTSDFRQTIASQERSGAAAVATAA